MCNPAPLPGGKLVVKKAVTFPDTATGYGLGRRHVKIVRHAGGGRKIVVRKDGC